MRFYCPTCDGLIDQSAVEGQGPNTEYRCTKHRCLAVKEATWQIIEDICDKAGTSDANWELLVAAGEAITEERRIRRQLIDDIEAAIGFQE